MLRWSCCLIVAWLGAALPGGACAQVASEIPGVVTLSGEQTGATVDELRAVQSQMEDRDRLLQSGDNHAAGQLSLAIGQELQRLARTEAAAIGTDPAAWEQSHILVSVVYREVAGVTVERIAKTLSRLAGEEMKSEGGDWKPHSLILPIDQEHLRKFANQLVDALGKVEVKRAAFPQMRSVNRFPCFMDVGEPVPFASVRISPIYSPPPTELRSILTPQIDPDGMVTLWIMLERPAVEIAWRRRDEVFGAPVDETGFRQFCLQTKLADRSTYVLVGQPLAEQGGNPIILMLSVTKLERSMTGGFGP